MLLILNIAETVSMEISEHQLQSDQDGGNSSTSKETLL
jgi:hypothetical protein